MKDPKIRMEFVRLEMLREAVAVFKRERGVLPSSLQELVPRFLPHMPADSWGQNYVYRVGDGKFLLYSAGLDGRDELGAGDDVTSKEKSYSCDAYAINCPPEWRGVSAIAGLLLSILGSLHLVYLGVAKLRGIRHRAT